VDDGAARLYCDEQVPDDRYSFPKSENWKLRMAVSQEAATGPATTALCRFVAVCRPRAAEGVRYLE
jgi:hypothetical protein